MQGGDSPEEIKRKCAERKAERKKKLGKSMTKTGNPRGRPKGGSLAVKALNDLVESKDFPEVVKSLVHVAKDSDHKAWAAAQKLLWDRVGHLSNFEKKGGGGNSPTVNINISGLNSVEIDGEVVDEQ